MSSIVTLTIVLLALAAVCLVWIILHKRTVEKSSGRLLHRFKKMAHENNLFVSVTDKLTNAVIGIDYNNNKMVVSRDPDESIIDLAGLNHCRKQKKWLHIPAGKDNKKPETHLEKIVLACEFTGNRPPVELVFYEYRYNSVFQLYELEQKADYWELLINQQIEKKC